MNKVIILGRLTKDPDVRYSAQTQKAVARFTLAIDDGYGENKKTNFIPVVAFGKTAEACEKYTGKGLRCAVEGKISTGSYTNKEGATVYTTEVLAERVDFIDWKDKASAPAEHVPQGFGEITESVPF